MRSLFIVSLPRSLSSDVFNWTVEALGLDQPSWVTDGEILNVTRYAHYHNVEMEVGEKFTLPSRNPQLCTQLHDFLDQVTRAEDFAYKDVVQPFVIASWRGLARFNLLRVERPLADVAYSMLAQRWYYPRFAATSEKPLSLSPVWIQIMRRLPAYYKPILPQLSSRNLEQAVLEGLVRAERTLAALSSIVISYDRLVNDESSLHQALTELYPGAEINLASNFTASFLARRERVLKRRNSRRYHELVRRIEQIRSKLTN